VRELQNTVERAIISWREGPLTFDLPASGPHESTREQVKSAAKAAFLARDELKQKEREAIINALKQTNGKVSPATRWRETAGQEAVDLRVANLLLGHQSQDARLRTSAFRWRTDCLLSRPEAGGTSRSNLDQARFSGREHRLAQRNGHWPETPLRQGDCSFSASSALML
jgi:hypothetical protein